MITEEAFKDIDYPDGITREDIGHQFCHRMTRLKKCSFILTNNCNICTPVLQEIGRNLNKARSINAVIVWRMKGVAAGNLSIWPEQSKGSTRRYDEFGLPNHDQHNPFNTLHSKLGAQHESKTPAS